MFSRTMTLVITVLLLTSASVAQATVLTFKNAAGADLGGYLRDSDHPGYGDAVTGNTALYSYGTNFGPTGNVQLTQTNQSNGGSLYLDFGTLTKGAVASSLTFTAAPGFAVVLHEFDIVVPSRGGYGLNYLRVFVDGIQVWGETTTAYNVGTTTYNEGDEWAPGLFTGSVVRLEWLDDGAGASYDAGFDNIGFSQLVPEPASLALLAAGGVLGLSRNRRSIFA